jgi:light-regulated signal transduction histidine kinase (bacteriophytochrome)
VGIDISAQKRAELEILRLNSELERRIAERTAQLQAANNELEAFCFSVSHDLRAPLRSVRGFNEVLLERYASTLDARGQEFLRRACEPSQYMDDLIDNLLKLSRVGRNELVHRPVHLSELAKAIAGELQQSDPSRAVHFKISRDLRASGDQHLLRIAIDNLLRNAWKFTSKRREACIEFGFAPAPDNAFFVRDNGAGFDAAYAGRLFDVFQRLHSASEFPGTGVGLATVQRIINRHGGRVWANGAVDRGATFYFSLPADETS